MTYGGVTEDGFIINPMTGVITTTKELDAEFQTHYTLTGTAQKNAHRNAQTRRTIPKTRTSSISSHSLHAVRLLSVFARDSGLPANFAKAVVRVEVQDVNDNAPVFAKPWYGLEVPENQEPVQLCFLKATDPDSGPGGELQYRITGEEQRRQDNCDKLIAFLCYLRKIKCIDFCSGGVLGACFDSFYLNWRRNTPWLKQCISLVRPHY